MIYGLESERPLAYIVYTLNLRTLIAFLILFLLDFGHYLYGNMDHLCPFGLDFVNSCAK